MDEVYIVHAQLPRDPGPTNCSRCGRLIGGEENALAIPGDPPELYCEGCMETAQRVRKAVG